MKSVKYLLDLQEKTGLNDTALGKSLDVTQAAISQYKSGKRIMDGNTCLKVAMQLGIDPLQVVGAAFIDRDEQQGKESPWAVFMTKAAATAAIVALATSVNLFLTPEDANARTYSPSAEQSSGTLYIM